MKNHPASRLKAEVRKTLESHGNAPPKDGYGQAAIMHTLRMRLTAAEFKKLRRVLKRFGQQAAEALECETLSMKEALLYLVEQLLVPGNPKQQ